MRNVEMKLSTGGAMDAVWLLAPGAAKEFAHRNVLVISDVPSDISDSAVAHLANATVINTSARPSSAPTVAFAQLGVGKYVSA